MGIYDDVELDAGLELPGGVDPDGCLWQSKSVSSMPARDTYRITADGRLLQKETKQVELTDEELAAKRAEAEEKEDRLGIEQFIPETKRVHTGWTQLNKHGSFTFYSGRHPAFDHVRQFEATFSHGQLEQIKDLGGRHDDEVPTDTLGDTVHYAFASPLFERFATPLVTDVLRLTAEHPQIAADGDVEQLVDRILDQSAQTNRSAVSECVRAVLGLSDATSSEDSHN